MLLIRHVVFDGETFDDFEVLYIYMILIILEL